MKTGIRVAVAALAFGLTGCTTGGEAPGEGETGKAGQRTESAASAPGDAAAETEACFDLECETTVTKGEKIAADGAHGITRVAFPRISREGMKIVLTGPDGREVCESTDKVLESCRVSPVKIDVTEVDGDTAVVSITS